MGGQRGTRQLPERELTEMVRAIDYDRKYLTVDEARLLYEASVSVARELTIYSEHLVNGRRYGAHGDRSNRLSLLVWGHEEYQTWRLRPLWLERTTKLRPARFDLTHELEAIRPRISPELRHFLTDVVEMTRQIGVLSDNASPVHSPSTGTVVSVPIAIFPTSRNQPEAPSTTQRTSLDSGLLQ